jgi:serine/threonine-protein kinase
MGEVYRARDTRLGRDVAIKVLPSQFALDPERVARFTREAQVLATLNHPNIAAIYGSKNQARSCSNTSVGQRLPIRIARGPLPLDEVLPVARAISPTRSKRRTNSDHPSRSEAGQHQAAPDGTVKVLDFGLAKLVPVRLKSNIRIGRPALTMSPTSRPAMTMAGVILGTAAYMSPSRRRAAADRRSDIWSFGCVLFEMLTGKRAFDGDDVSDTLAAVLRAEPDWSALPAATPRAIRTLLRRCLEKDRKRGSLMPPMLDWSWDEAVTERPEASSSSATTTRPSKARSAAPVAIGIVLAIALTSAAWWNWRPRPDTPIVTRFSIPLGDDEIMAGSPFRAIAISPDGRQICVGCQSAPEHPFDGKPHSDAHSGHRPRGLPSVHRPSRQTGNRSSTQP